MTGSAVQRNLEPREYPKSIGEMAKTWLKNQQSPLDFLKREKIENVIDATKEVKQFLVIMIFLINF